MGGIWPGVGGRRAGAFNSTKGVAQYDFSIGSAARRATKTHWRLSGCRRGRDHVYDVKLGAMIDFLLVNFRDLSKRGIFMLKK